MSCRDHHFTAWDLTNTFIYSQKVDGVALKETTMALGDISGDCGFEKPSLLSMPGIQRAN